MPPVAIPPPVTVDALLCGRVRAFGPDGEPSAIGKARVAGPLHLAATGLSGDEQGDVLHHGGTEKALHHYPPEHYAYWRGSLPQGDWQAGGFGENLSARGWHEGAVCLGDIVEWGDARLQVSQPRQPCWKLNVRFGVADMARRVQDSGRTGWYYRVLAGGEVRAGLPLRIVERPHPGWPLARVLHHLYVDPLDGEALAALAALPALAPRMRELLGRRLREGQVESWTKRLENREPPPSEPAA